MELRNQIKKAKIKYKDKKDIIKCLLDLEKELEGVKIEHSKTLNMR